MLIKEDSIVRTNKIKKASKYFGQLYNDAFHHISQLTKQLPDSIKEGLILDTREITSEPLLGSNQDDKIATLKEDISKMKGRKTNHDERLKKKKLKNKMKKQLKKKEKINKTIKKEEINSDENTPSLIFNKIDFSEVEPKKNKFFKKDRPRTEKDPAKALERIKKFREKVKGLKECGDDEKAKELINNESWKTAILKAEGLKVKDNVSLLKKTIKKKENMKKKSKGKWDERKKQLDKRKVDAQKKRKENIIKHKKDKKEKKIKRSIKKGRVVI